MALLKTPKRKQMMVDLWQLIQPVVEEEGHELLDIQLVPGRRSRTIKVLVYHPNGVKLDDCVRINRRLAVLLEAEYDSGDSYTLEVSSPGLFYEFRSIEDFHRFLDKRLKVVMAPGWPEGSMVFHGVIDSSESARFLMQVEGNNDSPPEEIILTLDNGDKKTLPVKMIGKVMLDPLLFAEMGNGKGSGRKHRRRRKGKRG